MTSTKIAVVLRTDLQTWQRLNVCSFLVSGLAATEPTLVGKPYQDADGTGYLPMLGHPVLVFEAEKEVLTSARTRALERGLRPAVFTSELFATGNDEANRAAVRAVRGNDLDLVGLLVFGPRNSVDKVVRGARLHP
nr:DUF2000 domain-containing protein [Saccharomonospora cyanea]